MLIVGNAIASPRSKAEYNAFRRDNPCPETGRTTGACPGWQVDHKTALVCGGEDSAANMQWLTIQEHKEKTRAEVKLCRGPAKPKP